ncbi:MAG: glycoside hydrolase family 5 protein [Lachnospiraceae bacterium]|nr:glycoside hydrolase family 5 protein [Lachnospiraceae bacterium]
MTPFEQYGKLHVEGKNLVDASGKPVVLKGISTHNLNEYPDYVNEAAFKQFRDEYNVNIMRLAMYAAFADNNPGYADSDDEHRAKLEELILKGVKICADLGLYCLVDWHILFDYNPNMHTDMAIRFFKNIAPKLKDYDNVIYEICNEPNMNMETKEETTWEDVKRYANQVIPEIKNIDHEKVIIVGTPTWSQRVDTASDSPLEYDNIMYALHFYADTHRDKLRDICKYARRKNLPIFVTEFGVGRADGDGDINDEESAKWLDLLDSEKISRVIWNLSNKNETSSILVPTCTKTYGFAEEDLTECGKRMKSIMSRM